MRYQPDELLCCKLTNLQQANTENHLDKIVHYDVTKALSCKEIVILLYLFKMFCTTVKPVNQDTW